MLTTLLPILAALQAAPADRPAVRVETYPQTFLRAGEPVRVQVDVARDGYLLVLRADTRGRIFVLHPATPDRDTFTGAGASLTLRDRHGNAPFHAFEEDGDGYVLAVLADRPFRLDDYRYGSQWSYRLLGTGYVGRDAVGGLLELAGAMAPGAELEWDVAVYRVAGRMVGLYDAHAFQRRGLCFGFGFIGRPWGLAYAVYQDDVFFADPFRPGGSCYGGYWGFPYGRWPAIIVTPAPDTGVTKDVAAGKPIEPRRRVPEVDPLTPGPRPAGLRGEPRARAGDRDGARDATLGRPQHRERAGRPTLREPVRPRVESVRPATRGSTPRKRPS
jgi:hypothetical protein